MGGLGGAWGGPGGPWGGLGDPIYYHESVAERFCYMTPSFERLLGGPRGAPGRSQAPFWSPRSDPDDKGAHSGGSQGRSRKVENHPGSVFWISQGVKCVYFQGFKQVHFVDLMWPLGAPGPPWAVSGGLGRARVGLGGVQGGAQGEMMGSWDVPGGSRGTGCRPQGGPGGPSGAQMSVLKR